MYMYMYMFNSKCSNDKMDYCLKIIQMYFIVFNIHLFSMFTPLSPLLLLTPLPDSMIRLKYTQLRKEMDLGRKRLQQEHEEQMETVLASRKSVERKVHVRQNNETNKLFNRHEHEETKK